MTAKQLEAYIRKVVPLSRQMNVRVGAVSDRHLVFRLPLKPNRNHLNTAFGGSLLGAQALACWAWLTWRLNREGLKAVIVIHKCSHVFEAPVPKDFTVRCRGVGERTWKNLIKKVRKGQKGRVRLGAEVLVGNGRTCRFTGHYVIWGQAE